MLIYNGSSVEQYITLTLISNELIVRNVITENTTGIIKALGITTLIMSWLEGLPPSPGFQTFASGPLLLPWMLRIPNLQKKKWAKGLLFCKKKYSNRHKWQHHGTLTAWQIAQIRWCVLFCPLISWKPEETAIKCKCRTSPEKVVEHVMSLFELLVILMLTNMKSILAYNMKHHKYMLFWGMLTKIVASKERQKI